MTENESEHYRKSNFCQELEWAKKLKTDVIEICSLGSTCAECSMYQSRYYSISGKTKCLPKLPQFIFDNQGLHCGNSFHAVLFEAGDKIDVYKYDKNGNCKTIQVDAVTFSNRPYRDDRSEFEKAQYENRVVENENGRKDKERYYDRNYWINEYYKHLEYHKIVELLGDKAPKSYSGYMRMKNNNTANYQKIAKTANENGIEIKS